MKATRADPVFAAASVIDASQMVIRSVITTQQPDRAGDIVVSTGLRNAQQFLMNPVVLWAHQRTLPPIGICQHLEINADSIVAETKFAQSSAAAQDIFRLYAEGVLRGWSIGFVPVKSAPLRGGSRIEQWDLLEYSAVPVPENPEALTIAVQKGMLRDRRLRDWFRSDVLAGLLAVA